MPTYEYKCKCCGHTFDRFQYITGPILRKCPVCKKLSLQRMIGAGGALIFKGSGWPGQDIARGERSSKGGSDAKE